MVHFRHNNGSQDVQVQVFRSCECLGFHGREKEDVNVITICKKIVLDVLVRSV